ncbi:polysaccharide deacetylase family protein [Micromonospora sp. HM5-17]|uniref:polysaccharide deacetylase family protein n=1 Tax=Micromonospora sp. HM5-17 TaxID=2487710 RepID=UPI000F4A3F4E|nr:polysaccharide deacetylase family protein [Micromonospora sp. HM5-17]
MGWRAEERVHARAVPATTLGAALAAQVAPAVTALPGIRLRFFPRLSGRGVPGHVALTFDDGPDPASTPHFLETLAAYRTRATFFLLGSMLNRAPELGLDLVAAGHEVAVHGWSHHNLLLRGPHATYRDLARTQELIRAVTGRPPRFFRPPYGVFSAAALMAARRLGLTPVLWTCWGRDWTRTATRSSVLRTLRSGLTDGGTVLLHDSDCTSAPGAWRASLAALPHLLDECRRRGWRVGPLGEHGAGRRETPARRARSGFPGRLEASG